MPTDHAPQTEGCQPHTVSVRSLVEFVLQAGDITPGGFQRRDRAQLGTQGHRRVQRSRPAGYETEVEISFQVEGADPPLELRGRIDGIYASQEPVIIEEIKTTTLSLELVGEQHNPLHWAQAQCYAYMYAVQQQLSGVGIHLTYYHLDSQEEKTFQRYYALAELQTFFCDLVTPYLDWFRKFMPGRPGATNRFNSSIFPIQITAPVSARWRLRSTKPSGPTTACMSNRLPGWERPSQPFSRP
jgi:DNA excision repair protein ERCC-2